MLQRDCSQIIIKIKKHLSSWSAENSAFGFWFWNDYWREERRMRKANGLTQWLIELFDSYIGQLLVWKHLVYALLKGWLHLVGSIGDRPESISHSTLTVSKVLLLVRHLRVAIYLYILKKRHIEWLMMSSKIKEKLKTKGNEKFSPTLAETINHTNRRFRECGGRKI